MPKEVGKVGSESPSFIEPVAERKDGIEAMFSKQTAAGSSTKSSQDIKPMVASPARSKRKHGDETNSPKKKTKAAHGDVAAMEPSVSSMKMEDEDSDIEIISPQPGSQVSLLIFLTFVPPQ